MLTEPWRIRLLGTFEMRSGDRVYKRCKTAKYEVVLAVLAWNLGQSISREWLVEQLWPDSTDGRGATNLRGALNSLRDQLEPTGVPFGSVVQNDGKTRVSLNPELATCDVVDFRRLIARSPNDSVETRLDKLMMALDLYKGELMPGHYEDIVDDERTRLSAEMMDVLQELSERLKDTEDAEKAVRIARVLADENPDDEEAQARLFDLLAVTGRHGEIIERYQLLERKSEQDLAAPPDDLRPFYEQARTQATRTMVPRPDYGPPPASSSGQVLPPSQGDPSAPPLWPVMPTGPFAPAQAAPTVRRTSLIPKHITRFFGREQEMERLARLVEEGQRLITLTGVGGTGKTRLAVEFATRLAENESWRVVYVPLADAQAAPQLVQEIARVLGLMLAPGLDPLVQIADVLSRERCLLVLDNLEQISVGAAPLILELLERAPTLTVLATSRHALDIVGEQQLLVEPLPVPSQGGTPERLMEFASVQLFVDRASKVVPDFKVTVRNADHIIRICQELEGLPLSLELAAGWASELSIKQVVARLEQKFELLKGRRVGLPPRQASLLASLEWSYRLLTPELQRVFASLSVFRGGWTLDAMQRVCSTPDVLRVISELRSRSLISIDRSRDVARYSMLEILREFAAQKLSPEDAPYLANRHAAYYAKLAAEASPNLRGEDQAEWLETLGDEQQNLHAALAWSLNETPMTGLRMAHDLFFYWTIRGAWTDARPLLRLAVQVAEQHGDLAAQADMVGSLGVAARLEGDLDEALKLAERSVELWKQVGDPSRTAAALTNLGIVQQHVGAPSKAIEAHKEALDVFRSLNDSINVASALTNLSGACLFAGDWSAARQAGEEALAIYDRLGDRWAWSVAALNVAEAACQQYDALGAWKRYAGCLPLLVRMGDLAHSAHALRQMAAVLQFLGRSTEAAVLCGAAVSIQERRGLPVDTEATQDFSNTLDAVRNALKLGDFQRAWADGASLSLDDLIDYITNLHLPE